MALGGAFAIIRKIFVKPFIPDIMSNCHAFALEINRLNSYVSQLSGRSFTDYRSLAANLLSFPQNVTCLLAGDTASAAGSNQSGS